jgi:hypothetical protein
MAGRPLVSRVTTAKKVGFVVLVSKALAGGRARPPLEKQTPPLGRGSDADPLGYPTLGVDPFGRVDAVSAIASQEQM